MRHADANSPIIDSDIDDEVREIINSTAVNKQIFRGQSPEDAKYTSSSLRYTCEDRPRRDPCTLDELPEQLQDEFRVAPLRLFGLEDSYLRFQVESWREISSQYAKARQKGSDQGIVISAPTGFGKTSAFMGEILKKILIGDPDSAIMVYPSRALLQDHLGRMLEIQNRLRQNDLKNNDNDVVERLFYNNFSIGVAMGRQPYKPKQVYTDGQSYVDTEGRNNRIQIANYWGDDISDTDLYVEETNNGYQTVTGHSGNDKIKINSDMLTLHRRGIKRNQPNLILTTLESLELLAMKPHYDTVEEADFFVFDEIHEYTGLRGAHAAEIIKNVRKIRQKEVDNDSALFVGASATIDDPQRFATDLFAFDRDLKQPIPTGPEGGTSLDQFSQQTDEDGGNQNSVSVLTPHEDDYDEDNNDKLHYYFMLSPDEGPGAASQYIQHAMMQGHALSKPDPAKQTDQSIKKQLAFVDSIGHINRLKVQFEDADRSRKLWQLHKDKEEGSWELLAQNTDHEFINRRLEPPVKYYSDADTSIDELRSSEHILATKFLEVGVDIDNLKYISQYRPPRDIKSFKQRSGRAAREPGESGHIFIHLSRFAGDSNFHYRAERFLDASIRTPLSTDNEVVSWIHDTLFQFYSVIYRHNSKNKSRWLDDSYENTVLEDYFCDTLEFEKFYEFLTSSQDFFSSEFDVSIADRTLLKYDIQSTKNKVQEEIEETVDHLSEIQKVTSTNVRQLLLREDVDEGLTEELRDRGASLGQSVYEEYEKHSENLSLQTGLEDAIQTLQSDEVTEKTNEERVQELEQCVGILLESLFNIKNQAKQEDIDLSLPSKRKFDDLYEATTKLKDIVVEGKLQEYSDRRKELYFLVQAVELTREYVKIPNSQGSLFAIKFLLQSSYYLNQALNVRQDSKDVKFLLGSGEEKEREFWYVPPNYFSDTGKYYTLKQIDEVAPEKPEDRTEEKSVESILSQYSPMKGEYVKEGIIQLFQPKIEIDDGEPVVDFSQVSGPRFDVAGERDTLVMPNKLELRKVPDLSESSGRQIVPFDPNTFEILTSEKESQADNVEYGKIHAKPQIRTHLKSPESVREERTGNLRIGQVDAQAWIESINLSIQPYEESLPGKFDTLGREHQIEQEIERSGPRLGYTLNTRGVVWDLGEFLDNVGDEIYEDAEKFKDFDKVDKEEAALVTAAHYLKLLVSDITGVDPEVLHYGYDTTRSEVYVFEEIEGGQGIIDLFYDDLHENPAASLNSVYRLLHNPQVFNEKIWAQRGDELIRKLSLQSDNIRKKDQAVIQQIIKDQTGITYSESISRIEEEILATIKKARNAAERYDISTDKFLNLKRDFSQQKLKGKEKPLTGIRTRHSDIFEKADQETMEDLFFSPDIDDCEMNLQLANTATPHAQSEYLSDVLLSALESYVIDRVPQDKRREALQERRRYWGRVEDEMLIYLRW